MLDFVVVLASVVPARAVVVADIVVHPSPSIVSGTVRTSVVSLSPSFECSVSGCDVLAPSPVRGGICSGTLDDPRDPDTDPSNPTPSKFCLSRGSLIKECVPP